MTAIPASSGPARRGDNTRNALRRGVYGLIAATLLLTACTGRGTDRSASSDDTLTIGQSSAPNSLDPAKTSAQLGWIGNLAYDPLIYKAADGALKPRLATSWEYVGAGNKVFELKLRPNVKFSDGSPLTADVVKANIDYVRKAHGLAESFLASIKTVDMPDSLTVRFTLSEPNPLLPDLFTQTYLASIIVSGAALKEPAKLATQTFGAGPYMLDQTQTVASDHYTYVPNPHYWDKQNVHYDKVVIKILPNPNTALSALKTGQVDVIHGNYTTATAATSAGLQVKHAPFVFTGLALADRAGDLVPALGDVRVRQALNYAVDRKKITKGLFGQYGTATEQIVLPGQDGHNDTTFYPYDPDKAKSLLAEAGYPNGFTLPVVTTSAASLSLVTQAIGDEFKNVGVRLKLTNVSDFANYNRELSSGKFPAYWIGYGTLPIHLMGSSLFLPKAALYNPFHSSDPQLTSLYSQAAAADPASRAELNKKIIARLADQAWFVPVTFTPQFVFARSTVAGIEPTAARPHSNPVEWHHN
jgi:peptide/nickel transport system substrate-binding protein